jgi:hypothetical protein
MKENWTNSMKQKLEGHQMTPPTGLWEGISCEMGFQKESVTKTVVIKRWLGAVAAIAIVLVGFFAIYQNDQSEPLLQASRTAQTPESTIINKVSPENQQLTLADVPQRAKTKVNTKAPTKAVIEDVSQQISDDMTQPASGNIPQQNSEETPQQTSEDNPQQNSLSTNRPTATNQQATANYQTKLASAKNERHSSTSKSEKWSIGLTASGGLLALVHQDTYYSGDYYADDLKDSHSPDNQTNVNRPNQIVHHAADKHHLPMRLGLSLHYQLNDALALYSGINYTYLYSESITSIDNQHLYYLGIPMGLSWQLWKTNGFSFYLSGSAMLEKCLNEKPWQWSLGAAAGAEYSFTSHVGVYLQPSLTYYFNDGTSFEHYYKEHPLAPSIEFGLRLHVFGK